MFDLDGVTAIKILAKQLSLSVDAHSWPNLSLGF